MLTDTLDRDVIDLATHLDELAARLRRAYHGMTITLADNGIQGRQGRRIELDDHLYPASPTAVSGAPADSLLILNRRRWTGS